MDGSGKLLNVALRSRRLGQEVRGKGGETKGVGDCSGKGFSWNCYGVVHGADFGDVVRAGTGSSRSFLGREGSGRAEGSRQRSVGLGTVALCSKWIALMALSGGERPFEVGSGS